MFDRLISVISCFLSHGLNALDLDGVEPDGEGEAFATPDRDGDLTEDAVVVDDDFPGTSTCLFPKAAGHWRSRVYCI
jgi:hypothetical protein